MSFLQFSNRWIPSRQIFLTGQHFRWVGFEIVIEKNICKIWISIGQRFVKQPAGAVSVQKCCIARIGIPIIKIRQPHDHLIFLLGIHKSGKMSYEQNRNFNFHDHCIYIMKSLYCTWKNSLYIETGPVSMCCITYQWVKANEMCLQYQDLYHCCFSTLRPGQNCCHFPDDSFKWIFLNENIWISIKRLIEICS